ncbi:MAG: outer membrane beta-barrel protein [Gemmatimonadota bacterium]
MRFTIVVVLVAVVYVHAPRVAEAQSPTFTVSGTHITFLDNDLRTLDSGFGFGFAAAYPVTDHIRVEGGYERSVFGIRDAHIVLSDDFFGRRFSTDTTGTARIQVVYVEPQVLFHALHESRSLRPYAAVRIGYVHHRNRLEDGSECQPDACFGPLSEPSRTGFSLTGSIGEVVELSSRFALVGALSIGHHQVSDGDSLAGALTDITLAFRLGGTVTP